MPPYSEYIYHSANLCERIIFYCLPEQKAVRAVVSFLCRHQSQRIYPYRPLPKSFGADAASSGQRTQPGANSIRQRLCRPVTLYPGFQEVLRIYAHVFAESIKSIFRFVHQSRVNVPFVLSGFKRFSYFCRLIH